MLENLGEILAGAGVLIGGIAKLNEALKAPNKNKKKRKK